MTTTAPSLPADWRENLPLAEQTLARLRAAKAARTTRQSFASPGALAQALDPSTVQTPALELIDRALVRVADGITKRLIISMPPQEGKSERTTHYGALWMLHRNPGLRLGIVSYADDIAGQFSTKMRNDIAVFDGTDGNVNLDLHLQPNSRAASRWGLAYPNRGGVIAVGIGSALTGRPVDALFIDDPVKDFRAADSELLSEQAWTWWQSVARPRLHPEAPVILILTRWSELDLAGRLLTKQKQDAAAGLEFYDRWEVINIPALADHDPEKGQTDPLGREPGEFMLSARGRTRPQWLATLAATGSRAWTALYQGRPSPESGNVWKREWWRRYPAMLWTAGADGSYHVEGFDEVLQSWDMAFKDTKGSDYVVGQVWARRDANVYLLEQIRRRLSFTDTVTTLLAVRKRWPQARMILIEDKANGTAVIDTLRDKVGGIVPVTPHESKYARANAVAPYIESGNVFLPGAEISLDETDPEALIDEAAAFPNAAHDDQVDATSQALARFFIDGAGATAWLAWLEKRIAGTLPDEPAIAAPVSAEPARPEPEPEPGPELTDIERLRAARTAVMRGD